MAGQEIKKAYWEKEGRIKMMTKKKFEDNFASREVAFPQGSRLYEDTNVRKSSPVLIFV